MNAALDFNASVSLRTPPSANPATMPISRIWIDEGCISCNLCEDLAPAIFEVPVGADCTVRRGYRAALGDEAVIEQVEEAADSCPTEVIIVERD